MDNPRLAVTGPPGHHDNDNHGANRRPGTDLTPFLEFHAAKHQGFFVNTLEEVPCMRRFVLIGTALSALALVPACDEIERKMSTPEEAQRDNFERNRRAMLDDPNARNAFHAQCMADANLGDKQQREAMARRMGTAPRNLRRTYCDRIVAAVIDGRLGYQDIAAVRTGKATRRLNGVVLRG